MEHTNFTYPPLWQYLPIGKAEFKAFILHVAAVLTTDLVKCMSNLPQ